MNKLDFTIQAQEQSEWCWAAVTASITNFYAGNNRLRQCALVNRVFLLDNCCDDGTSASCNQPFDLKGALRKVNHLQKRQAGQPSLQIVTTEINAGRPLAVRIRWSEGGGHAVVIYGVTDDRKVNIADPDHANDEILVPFDDFVYRDIGTWDDSLFTS